LPPGGRQPTSTLTYLNFELAGGLGEED